MAKKKEYALLSEMTDQEIEKRYEGNDALISIKKLEKIKSLISGGYEELEKFKGEDISVFVGNTRSGKSTVINTILDNTLFASIKGRKTHLSISDDENGPEIGNSSASETTVPSRYESKDLGVIWDCPGYDDNRGDTQDIVNNFYIKKLLEDAKSIKLFVVSDFNDVDAAGVPRLISLTKSIDLSFGSDSDGEDISVLHNLINNKAIGIIVTKSDEDDEEIVKQIYKDDFLDVTGISKTATADDLIRHFIGKSKAMCIVPKITKDYIQKDGVVDGTCLKEPIFSLFLSLNNFDIEADFSVRPGLSPSAQKFIYNYYTDEGMLSEFKNFFGFIENKSSSYLSVLNLNDKDLLDKLLTNIVNKMEYIDKFMEDISSFNSLKDLVVSIKDALPSILDPMNEDVNQEYVGYIEKYFADHNMVSQAVFLDFLAGSILKVNSSLKPVVEKFFSNLKSNYSGNINDIYLQLGRIKEDEHLQKQEELLEERKRVENDYKAELKQREKERIKQAEDFAKQQKEDLIKHREEQNKIRVEMAKQLQQERDVHAKEIEKRSKEWEEIQKKIAADHAKAMKDMGESHSKDIKTMQESHSIGIKNMQEFHSREVEKINSKWQKNQEELCQTHISKMNLQEKDFQKNLESMNKEFESKMKKNTTEHDEQINKMSKMQSNLEVKLAKRNKQIKEEREKFEKKVNEFVSEKDISAKALEVVTKAMNQMKLDRETDSQAHKEQMDKMNQMMEDLRNKPPQIIEKTIIERRGGCVIFSVLPKYDNPLLNDEDLVKDVKNKFGDAVLNNFIDLCSNFTDEEYEQIRSSSDVMDSVRSLMGISENVIFNDSEIHI